MFKMRRDCDTLRGVAEIEERCRAPYGVRYEVEKWYANIVKQKLSAERYVLSAGMSIAIRIL